MLFFQHEGSPHLAAYGDFSLSVRHIQLLILYDLFGLAANS